MGKEPAQPRTDFVVPQPKRYSGGKILRNRILAMERVQASRSAWRPIEPTMASLNDLPLENCFHDMMLNSENMHGESWEDDGRPLSSASEYSIADYMNEQDDPLSEDEELMGLCAPT